MSEQKIRFQQPQRDPMADIDVETHASHGRERSIGADRRAAGIPRASGNCYRACMNHSGEHLSVRRDPFEFSERQARAHHERVHTSGGIQRLAACRTKQRQLAVVKSREIRDETHIPVEVVRDRRAPSMQVADAIAVRSGSGAPEGIS